MANPQIEDGHIRIANELYDEIIRRNFTKRQQNLVLFIWRLSYGTGQKDCEIKNFSLFELAGLYRSDVKKELNYLRECAVLNWDEETMIFSINKNYKLWQITPNKNWDSEKFNQLIHHNILRKKVSKKLTNQNKKVSKTPTDNIKNVSETLIKGNSEVSKLLTGEDGDVSESLTKKEQNVSNSLTSELVNYQQGQLENLSTSSNSENLYPLLYPSFITNYKNNSFYYNKQNEKQTASQFYEENGFGLLGGYAAEMMIKWLEKFNDEILILAMKEAIENDAKNWRYLNKILSDWEDQGVKTVQDAKAAIAKFRDKTKRNYNQTQKQEVIPDWFYERKSQKDKPLEEQKIVEMERILQKYKKTGGEET